VSKRDDQEVEQKLRWYAELYPTRGCPFYTKRIRKEGYAWNKKRVRRVYNQIRDEQAQEEMEATS